MKAFKQSLLLMGALTLLLGAPAFNAATQDQSAVGYRSFSSPAAILEFLNQQADNNIELENVQVTATDDGTVQRFSVFFRETQGTPPVAPWVLQRFSVTFSGFESDASEQAAHFAQQYLNYVDGDESEPNLAVRNATLALHTSESAINYEVFHRPDDRGDPGTYGWEWFSRDGARELAVLLQEMNGQYQEDPRIHYPSDIVSRWRADLDEHVFYAFYQVGMLGAPNQPGPVGWQSLSFSGAKAVVDFLNANNPEEFRVAADYGNAEKFRLFWR